MNIKANIFQYLRKGIIQTSTGKIASVVESRKTEDKKRHRTREKNINAIPEHTM